MSNTDPTIMLGKPCLAGTRITVEEIRTRLHAGEPVDDIIAAYPGHEEEIRAVAMDAALDDLESAHPTDMGVAPPSDEPPFRYGGEGVEP